jgi:hypothetical protein
VKNACEARIGYSLLIVFEGIERPAKTQPVPRLDASGQATEKYDENSPPARPRNVVLEAR